MATISIPFMPEFKVKMLFGRKTTTWRTSIKGEPGDIFQAFGEEFRILRVEPMTQGELVSSDRCVYSEGFTYGWELHDVLDKLYRRAGGYDPDRQGYLHTFEKVSP